MRIVFFGDIHFSRAKSERERIDTEEAVHALKEMIPIFQSLKPDLFVAMGDFIQKSKRKEAETELDEILEVLQPLSKKLLFLKGNHEEMSFGSKYFSSLLEKHQFNSSLHGSQTIDLFNIHRLEVVEFWKKREKTAFVPKHQIEELKKHADKPTIVLMHQAPKRISMDHNFYYERLGNINSQAVSDEKFYSTISKIPNIKLIVHAHTHWHSATFTGSIPTIGNPSFSEMIGSKLGPMPSAQSYGLLDISIDDKNQMKTRWQSLSHKLAYTSMEFLL